MTHFPGNGSSSTHTEVLGGSGPLPAIMTLPSLSALNMVTYSTNLTGWAVYLLLDVEADADQGTASLPPSLHLPAVTLLPSYFSLSLLKRNKHARSASRTD